MRQDLPSQQLFFFIYMLLELEHSLSCFLQQPGRAIRAATESVARSAFFIRFLSLVNVITDFFDQYDSRHWYERTWLSDKDFERR